MYFRLILTDFPDVPIAANLRLLTKKKQREPRLTLRESGLSLSSPQFGRQPSAPVPKKAEKAATTVKICIAFSDQLNDELKN